ncbi:MAG: hypothetical protein HN976_40655 [Lentisphaerae bacterium]|nr:hypothetical protein [Lentisphaerota bacterium]MBT7061468.1 hypothetical protein [Lentisphaerota bacterium]
MGTSTGKVPAILDYCRGMWLLELKGADRSAVKHPELTPFGRAVLFEDPYLKERVTQWIAHLNLCGPRTGADAWYHTFFAGGASLGPVFAKAKLGEYLSLVYGTKQGGLIGPVVRMYEDGASFRVCNVLSESAGTVQRKAAPVTDSFGYAYGAWILHLMETHFPGVAQVTVTELDAQAGLRTIPGWDVERLRQALQLIEQKGVIGLDRHMDPWLVRPARATDEAWSCIYDDLI